MPEKEPAIPDLWSASYVALYAHYACVGMVGGLLTTMLQPYCLYVIEAPPNTCASINTFINLPFGFKLFYGMVSDCVPIFGQHRKPYLVGGWGLCFAAALLGALSDELDLPTSSSLFLAMTVAYLVADCAADAALVGYSALEPKETRGSMLSTAYSIRFGFNVLAALAVALLYNGPASGGSFSWGLSLQQLLWLPVGFVGLLMGATLPMLHEEPAPSRRMRFGHRLVQVAKLVQQHAVWRLVLGLVLTTMLGLVSNQAVNNANARWFHMTPLQLSSSNCLQSLCLSLGMWAYKRYLLHVSWRKTYTSGIAAMQLFNLAYLLTVYLDVFKNGWWVVFTSVNIQLAYAFTFVIGVLVVPEITIPGFEGVVYGAVTSFTNQAQNMTNAINNLLLAIWPSNTSNEQLDLCALPGITAGIDQTGAVRAAAVGAMPQGGEGEGEGSSAAFTTLSRSYVPRGVATSCREVQLHMTYLTLLGVAIAFTSLLFMPLLPRQKAHVAEMMKRPPSKLAGHALLLIGALLMLLGPGFACLSIFSQTACLQIAGGIGCGDYPFSQ